MIGVMMRGGSHVSGFERWFSSREGGKWFWVRFDQGIDRGLYIIDGGGLMEECAKGDIRCGLFVLHWVGFGFRECILE